MTATVPQAGAAPQAPAAFPPDGVSRTAAARPRLILGALVLAMLAFTVVQTSVVPILPTLSGAFHLTTATVAWAMTANLLAAAVLTPLLGRMGDLYGRKWVLVLSISGLVLHVRALARCKAHFQAPRPCARREPSLTKARARQAATDDRSISRPTISLWSS